jgi:hypothetical protein
METPKTFKELFANTGIEPTTDESGNTHYNFKAAMKDTLGKEFYESADKTIKVTKQETLEEVRDLAYYKANAEEDYLAVPISVLRYISQLEQQERSYSKEDMINFVEFVSQYYADDSMENSSIYELLEKFKNK